MSPTWFPLKECDRALKRAFGRGDTTAGDSYDTLKERLCEQLYEAGKAEEGVVQRRIESLTANVRREVEDKLADQRAEQEATAAALEEREQAVAERERQARPSYRAAFAACGAFLALSGGLVMRTVA